MNQQLDPGHIMQTATGFWAAKVLLTAVELDLFTTLGDRSLPVAELGQALELHERGTYDFFDALVALGFLDRVGDGPAGRYRNTAETAAFLNKKSPKCIGGMPEMLNSRLFGFRNHLGTALKTGQPQSEVETHGKPLFEELYAHTEKLGEFLAAMAGFQAGNFMALAEKFDFSRYETVGDIGGALIAVENLIDDARRENAFGLLMSLNMLIEVGDAFDYTGADFRQWCTEAGFRKFEIIPLMGPSSAAVAYK